MEITNNKLIHQVKIQEHNKIVAYVYFINESAQLNFIYTYIQSILIKGYHISRLLLPWKAIVTECEPTSHQAREEQVQGKQGTRSQH